MSDMRTRAAAIRALEDGRGRVTAEQLVQAARSARHPLHDDFVWDDKVAGHRYRLDQARKIIASVRMIPASHDSIRIATVSYLRDPEAAPDEQGYRNITRIRSERDHALTALMAEVDRAKSALERAREVAAGLDLLEELEEAMNGVNLFAARLRRGPAANDEDGDESRPT